MTKYWMVTGTPENFTISADLGWTLQGFKSRHRRMASAMEPGDLLIYYLTGLKVFGGVTKVTSRVHESHEPVWHSEAKPPDDYPWRVAIAPVAVLKREDFLPAEPLAHRMTHAAKWPPANWPLAFQGNLHLLPQADGELLVEQIKAAAK